MESKLIVIKKKGLYESVKDVFESIQDGWEIFAVAEKSTGVVVCLFFRNVSENEKNKHGKHVGIADFFSMLD